MYRIHTQNKNINNAFYELLKLEGFIYASPCISHKNVLYILQARPKHLCVYNIIYIYIHVYTYTHVLYRIYYKVDKPYNLEMFPPSYRTDLSTICLRPRHRSVIGPVCIIYIKLNEKRPHQLLSWLYLEYCSARYVMSYIIRLLGSRARN